MYRIISIDGGGVYGIITACLIARLAEVRPDLIARADLIAGTSIGGIIALSLAKGDSPNDLHAMFLEKAPGVFRAGVRRSIMAWLGMAAFYDRSGLHDLVDSSLGTMTLADLRKRVLIPSFLLDDGSDSRWKAKIFHNYEGAGSDRGTMARDVALATASAPMYFPIFSNYLDGCFTDNNPSMCAVAQTQDRRYIIEPRPAIAEITMLSFGRESRNHAKNVNGVDWGYLNWSWPILQIILDRDSRVVHYQTEKLLGENYHRIAPALQPELEGGIDDISKLHPLDDFAAAVDLAPTIAWLESHW